MSSPIRVRSSARGRAQPWPTPVTSTSSSCVRGPRACNRQRGVVRVGTPHEIATEVSVNTRLEPSASFATPSRRHPRKKHHPVRHNVLVNAATCGAASSTRWGGVPDVVVDYCHRRRHHLHGHRPVRFGTSSSLTTRSATSTSRGRSRRWHRPERVGQSQIPLARVSLHVRTPCTACPRHAGQGKAYRDDLRGAWRLFAGYADERQPRAQRPTPTWRRAQAAADGHLVRSTSSRSATSTSPTASDAPRR